MQDDHRRLQDILECAHEIQEYLDGINEMDFVLDRMRQRAVERLLTIIGEAAKNLSGDTRQKIRQPWREIIRLRDKGVHHYDSLTPATLYRIATESVPDLRLAIEKHLD